MNYSPQPGTDEVIMNNRPDNATFTALEGMISWLNACRAIGWEETAMDDLEQIWWLYHDEKGESCFVK